MQRKRVFILMALFMLMASTLACGLFGGGDEAKDSPAADQAAESSSNEPMEQEQPANNPAEGQSEAPASPNLDLGEEYRSEEGGYAFQPISGYEFEEFFGLATMVAPNADPDLGPLLMLIGGTNETEATSDEIFAEFMEGAESEAVEILDQKEISVGGKSGLLADVSGDTAGQQIVGRIVVVAVTPTQQFTMFASAPRDRWDEVESAFDAVLASVHFFEPEEIDFAEELDLEAGDGVSDEVLSDDTAILDIPALEDFPTDASQLPPGGFVYLLASEQGFPTIVAQGNLQDQSTSAEYVIGLVSEDQQNTLTLFIPLDVAPGILQMKTYDKSSATKGPGATVYAGLTLHTNTDGIIMIDTMENNTITGSVYFTALDEDGNQIAVTGFFNELPLAPK